MEISLIEKDTFFICGFCVETTAAQNDSDISALYNDFFGSGKEELLKTMKGAKKGYYGLSWYTQGHERYCYLLGIEIAQVSSAPGRSIIKKAPAATYAKASFGKGEDIIKAWTDLFYKEIPQSGLEVDQKLNAYFEYYPDNVRGDYELWVPVVASHV